MGCLHYQAQTLGRWGRELVGKMREPNPDEVENYERAPHLTWVDIENNSSNRSSDHAVGMLKELNSFSVQRKLMQTLEGQITQERALSGNHQNKPHWRRSELFLYSASGTTSGEVTVILQSKKAGKQFYSRVDREFTLFKPTFKKAMKWANTSSSLKSMDCSISLLMWFWLKM